MGAICTFVSNDNAPINVAQEDEKFTLVKSNEDHDVRAPLTPSDGFVFMYVYLILERTQTVRSGETRRTQNKF